jgi:hypothetical protein
MIFSNLVMERSEAIVTGNQGGKEPGLAWKRVFALFPIGAIGALGGQVIFDIANYLSGGRVVGFLVSLINSPQGQGFWGSLEIAIFLLRWIFGAGALGLSFALALGFSARRAFYVFSLGCLLGASSWVSTGYLVARIPSDLYIPLVPLSGMHLPFFSPYTVKALLPGILVCLSLGLATKEFRPFFLKLSLAGLLGGVLGTELNLALAGPIVRFIMESGDTVYLGLNPVRITGAVLVTAFINLTGLVLIKETLRKRARPITAPEPAPASE